MEFDYMSEFYKQTHNEKTLIEGIDSILGIYDNIQAKVFPCHIEKNFINNIFNNTADFRIIYQNENISHFEYSHEIKSKNNPYILSGKFFVLKSQQYENIYTIITLEDSDYFNRCLMSFFRNSYPRISLTFITHRHLQRLLVQFREKNTFRDFQIVKASVKYRVEKNVFSSIHWQNLSLEKAFEWVRDENGWFESLTVKTQKEMSLPIRISISREGIIKTYGFFSAVFTDFITPISKMVYENVTFFGRRARLENNGEIRPLCIDFEYNHFDSIDENKKFIESMKGMKSASVSVIHGNPYIQLSILDYFDGSSYDIWILSEDKIIIVPQLKSSFQAIKRLINHIFDNYYEGHIKEYEVSYA